MTHIRPLTTKTKRSTAEAAQLAIERHADVEAKLAAVGRLAASVAHELRNPLTAVRNAHTYIARRIAKDDGALGRDPRLIELSEIVERELNACSKIIGDLLDFARDRPPTLSPCPLGPLADEAISLVATEPHVRVENEIPPDMPVPNLDRDQFRQIVINLVQNAVEAMPADREGVVCVRAEGGMGRPWRISVTDNGTGIPNDIASKIFQPLFTTKTKGTGLGLAIVSSLVERHRGTVAVQSPPGQGATFVIELPPDEPTSA